ncbi:MAG: hypothetical protein MUF63_15815 [Rhodobacteraceae bacterium]|jgi:hypothetical protein|nr:hypothetical protein [Paracoccaceae bacterium]
MTPRTLLLALAASAALLSPALATQAAAQGACTQLESSAGLRGDDCGKLTTAQIAVLHGDRAGG